MSSIIDFLLDQHLGGVAGFGAFGLLLGPLLVRLAVEAWESSRRKLDAAASRPIQGLMSGGRAGTARAR